MEKTNTNNISQLANTLSSIDVQQMLLSKAKNSVLEAAVHLLEQDMQMLCGKAFSRKTDGELCHRGGTEKTSLLLDGVKYPMRRPRARKDSVEVELPSLAKLRDVDLLDEQMLSRLVKGVSTRNYADVISGLSEKTGVSKSSVSRAFSRASRKHLDELNGRDLSGHKFVALLIDGTVLGGQTMVAAVGVTDDNEKIPLGVLAGDTENAEVVKDLLTSMTSRGFTFAANRILVVLDGGKALRSAVKAIWGEAVLIQRCWLHKLRNLKEYIPEVNHGQLWRRMKRIMGLVSHAQAKKELRYLRDWLSTISDGAVTSLDEAGEELLTVHSLGLRGTYRRSLSSTNVIESLIGVVKNKSLKVKNWNYHPKTGSKVARDKTLRWTATAIITHEKKLRRLYGGKNQIETLLERLNSIDCTKRSA